MVYSAGKNSELPPCRKHKHAHIAEYARCCGQYESEDVKPSKFRKHSKEVAVSGVQTTVVTAPEQMKRPHTKTADEHYMEGKPSCTEVINLPCSKLTIR